MVRERRDFPTETPTKASIKTTGSMDLELIIGNKEKLLTRESSKMVSGMAKENGHREKQNIQVTTLKA
jgi:hypothetical protein